MKRIALLAHPGSGRAEGFAAAWRAAGGGDPYAISWERALAPGFDLGKELAGAGWEALRIETPAEHPEVERLLLIRGAAEAEREGIYPYLRAAAAQQLPDDDGRLRHQRQWYLGWSRTLAEIARVCEAAGVRVMNAPAEIAVLFDKQATREILLESQVPVPAAAGLALGFDDLVAKMDAAGWQRVFLKPCHGSSAAGVMAISRGPGGRWSAFTSASLQDSGDGPAIYNSKRPRRLSREAVIRATVDAVCRERALVERWFPKATLDGRAFDLRILVIAGRAAQVAVRTSATPITNLHLRNRRGDLERTRQAVGEEMWRTAMATAEAAARCFPGCHYVGVDLMIGAARRTCAVAEVNAFGDDLHHERWQGMNAWEAEVALWGEE